MEIVKKFVLSQEEKKAFTTVMDILETVCTNCDECEDCPLRQFCVETVPHEYVGLIYTQLIK